MKKMKFPYYLIINQRVILYNKKTQTKNYK
jgi:hypothetical protein